MISKTRYDSLVAKNHRLYKRIKELEKLFDKDETKFLLDEKDEEIKKLNEKLYNIILQFMEIKFEIEDYKINYNIEYDVEK